MKTLGEHLTKLNFQCSYLGRNVYCYAKFALISSLPTKDN